MIEKTKEDRDKHKICVTVFTNPSKAFDCLKHDLLILKLHAFGFSYNSRESSKHILGMFFNYQKLDSSSVKFMTFFCVPQGSILGLLLFNTNIIELYLI